MKEGMIGIAAEEEVDATKIYLDHLNNPSLMTAEEEKKYFGKYQEGLAVIEAVTTSQLFKNNPTLAVPILDKVFESVSKTYEYIVLHNQRLVISIAKKSRIELPILDKIQNGNMGLFKAIDGFDPSLGYKFSTYATPKIEQAIKRHSIYQETTIRIPYGRIDKYSKIIRFRDKFLQENGREASDKECADYLGYQNCTIRSATHAATINDKIMSLDRKYDSDNEDSDYIGDSFPDTFFGNRYCVENAVFDNMEKAEKIKTVLDILNNFSNSNIYGKNIVKAFVDHTVNPELDLCDIADKYSINRDSINNELAKLQTYIYKRIGVPAAMFTSQDKPHKGGHRETNTGEGNVKRRINLEQLDILRGKIENGDRDVDIYLEYCTQSGVTIRSIAKEYRLTRQRISQILHRIDDLLLVNTPES